VSDPFHDGNKGAVWIYHDYGILERAQVLSSSWWTPRLARCEYFFGTSVALGQASPYLAIGCGKPGYSVFPAGTPILTDLDLNGTTAMLRTHDNGESFGFHQELAPPPTKGPWFGSAIAFTGSSDDKLLITSDDGISLFQRRDDQSWARAQDLPDGSRLAVAESQFVVADRELNLDAYALETCDDFLISSRDDITSATWDDNVTYTLTAWEEYVVGWAFPGRTVEVPATNFLCLRDGCYRLDVPNTTIVSIRYGALRRSYQFLGDPGHVQFQFRVNDGWIRYTGSTCSDPAPAPTSFPTMLATPAPASSSKKKNNGLSDGAIAGVVVAAVVITIAIAFLVTRAVQESTAETPVAGKDIVKDIVVVDEEKGADNVPPTTTEVEMK